MDSPQGIEQIRSVFKIFVSTTNDTFLPIFPQPYAEWSVVITMQSASSSAAAQAVHADHLHAFVVEAGVHRATAPFSSSRWMMSRAGDSRMSLTSRLQAAPSTGALLAFDGFDNLVESILHPLHSVVGHEIPFC